MSQNPQQPIPVGQPVPQSLPQPPYAPFGPPKKGMPPLAIVGIVLGAVVVTGGVIWILMAAMLGSAMGTANRGMCKHKLKSLTTVSKALYTLDDSPIGAKWIEGFDYNASSNTYDVEVPNNNIRKSRLAFWRMIADPAIRDRNVSPGGPQAFICPSSSKPKQPAQLVVNGVKQRDFADPRRELFYSMFNQGLPGIVPQFGTNPQFVIMGDRSPKDDGYDLDANSGNHRWGNTNTGQNICYSSGAVAWVEETAVGIDEDEIYMAGMSTTLSTTDVPVHEDDTVLMPVAD